MQSRFAIAAISSFLAIMAVACIYWSPNLLDNFYDSKYVEISLASASPWIYLPYPILVAAAIMSRGRLEIIITGIIVIIAIAIGPALYWEAVRFNLVFLWRNQGTVIDCAIWVQMAVAIATLIVITRRRWLQRHTTQATSGDATTGNGQWDHV